MLEGEVLFQIDSEYIPVRAGEAIFIDGEICIPATPRAMKDAASAPWCSMSVCSLAAAMILCRKG